jgi:V/A-type H+-transporting ATPase subunit I
MRPHPAIWFELLTSREDLGSVLECLARSGTVELETYSDVSQPDWLPEMQDLIAQFHSLSEQYHGYWPKPGPASAQKPRTDIATGRKIWESLKAWSAAAEPLVKELQGLAAEENALQLITRWIASVPPQGLPDLAEIGRAGPVMSARLYVLPPGQWPTTAAASVMLHKSQSTEHNFLLALGPEEQVKQLDQLIHALKGRALVLPHWLPGGGPQALEGIRARLDTIRMRRHGFTEQLDQLTSQHDLPALLAQLRFLTWVVENVPQLSVTEHFAWVTGWTSDPDQQVMRDRLEKDGHNCLVRFPPAPARSLSPMILRNPGWARPFELFARLLGTPSAAEADPSALVAVLAPTMFGLMFGDVGQGAVLMLAGLLLRKHYPALRMLIPGGLMAMLFGLLFGSVFANESLLPALWLHPMSAPLPVLKVSLGLGAGVICLGLGLDAVQAHWAGRAGAWWRARAGLILSYVSALASLLWINMLWVSLAGMAWFVIGHGLAGKPAKLQAAASALAEFAETMLQLLVNTVSFVRVGAFALAHSGLSMAIAGIAQAFESLTASLLVYIVGNLFVLTLEALVVGIQATRLVLFEFFIRFLRAEGRAFRPLQTPEHPSGTDIRR